MALGDPEAAPVTTCQALASSFSPILLLQQIEDSAWWTPFSRGRLVWAVPCLYLPVHMHIDPRVYINAHLPTHAHQRHHRRLSGTWQEAGV